MNKAISVLLVCLLALSLTVGCRSSNGSAANNEPNGSATGDMMNGSSDAANSTGTTGTGSMGVGSTGTVSSGSGSTLGEDMAEVGNDLKEGMDDLVSGGEAGNAGRTIRR